ncbi:hypothetical protein CCR95_01580 [Thiocystis minor]|uniref:hypothetical protein n=1 Tax=Thiocystis minor TaxID=61597 RepID=UPI001914671B|nr:hypothetical protein [Thiocystis minor]MBK5962817.1 hypothetical protein [Thiocystis minor]
MSIFWKESVVFLKLWLLLLLTYLMGVLAFDLTFYGWIDLRQDAIARLIYLPLVQTVAFQLLTYPRRHKPQVQ